MLSKQNNDAKFLSSTNINLQKNVRPTMEIIKEQGANDPNQQTKTKNFGKNKKNRNNLFPSHFSVVITTIVSET